MCNGFSNFFPLAAKEGGSRGKGVRTTHPPLLAQVQVLFSCPKVGPFIKIESSGHIFRENERKKRCTSVSVSVSAHVIMFSAHEPEFTGVVTQP